MEKSFLKRATWEVLRSALCNTAFCMFAMAIVAVIVKNCAPSDVGIHAMNWAVKCLGAFVFSLVFIRKERSLVKGIAAGILGVLFTLFLFAAIGGGFYVTAFFPLELFVCALLGGAGALLGAKLRKE